MAHLSGIGGSRVRAFVAVFAPLVALASACGDVPTVTSPGNGLKPSAGGSSGAGSGSGGTGLVGTGGSINPGDLGGQGNDSSGGAPDNTPAVCGNGHVEPGELCDDGNTDDDDGCSGDCSTVDPDYYCADGEACVRVVTCGNGVIEGDEVCDDGNTDDDDGCSSTCDAIDDGYVCIKPGELCVALAVCGNGVREHGEACDDGNTDDKDGCSSSCELEQGYFCAPDKPCVKLVCGDGNRTPDEACDDGNKQNGDGCSSACKVESGWQCGTSGCRPVCGDGVKLGDEACDDHNTTSGDGCSSACKVEPFYQCTSADPSVCTSTIVCGDGTLSPGEVCDPGIPGEQACYSPTENVALACKGFDTGILNPPVCNNGVVEYMEGCDGNVTGCTNCTVDPGYVCPAASICFKLPLCGDGVLQAGEDCDVGVASGPGCSACKIQDGYFCSGEPSVCVASVCGDGIRAPNEQCDDGGKANGDGCSSTCTIETGWACPPNLGCSPVCGDGVRTATEECDPTPANTTACTNCKLNAGYTCGTNGLGPCAKTACPNGIKEPGEGCDDGNVVAGDGCGPTCQLEPGVTVGPDPVVAVTCGDGLTTGTEGCDDGNKTSGDGCSSSCQVESGWTCSGSVSYPDSIAFKVTYRDFKQRTEAGGHPHMKANGAGDTTTQAGSPGQGNDPGIVGTVCTTANGTTCGRLDSEGKPAYVGTGTHTTIDTTGDGLSAAYHQDAFKLWYRNSNANAVNDPASQSDGNGSTNVPIDVMANPTPVPAGGDTIVLKKLTGVGVPATKSAYQFDSTVAGDPNTFYPLGNANDTTPVVRGFGYTPGFTGTARRNWQFTTELRYFFQYQGGETLTFFGDDDVWVFINGRLAVDIGGIHGQTYGRVILGDDGAGTAANDSNCTVNEGASLPTCTLDANETAAAHTTDNRFGLTKGGVYEIVVFQAERHPTGSDYQLTLDGFLAPRSFCQTDCGDGIKAGSEQCDTGRNMPLSGYGVCLKSCTIQFCGDGSVNGSEQCDNRTNATLYGTSGCAPGCVLPAHCGDGTVQAGFNEECDKGSANANGVYGGCTTSCKLGPYCGDGSVTNGEDCDTPGAFTTYGTSAGKCNYDCKFAPYCGDGVRNGTELCDGGAGCNAQCEFAEFCGDGLKEGDEQCDYGQFGFSGAPKDAPYGGCTTDCELGPYCGDGKLQSSDGEECDKGSKNTDNTYDGCTTACLLGPRCGDGVLQKGAGETCDNGFNEDAYAYPGELNACGPDCQAVPYCGDGKVQSAFELCDDGKDNADDAYNGCTTSCDWGPYCGDSIKNGSEACDDGPNNKAYSADGKGCSYECTKNLPYCGDGVRNGPEQCDDGTAKNTGKYGGCNTDCTNAPYCGDKIVQKNQGEQCDDGPSGSSKCRPNCTLRSDVPR